jgi:hypothetical protein
VVAVSLIATKNEGCEYLRVSVQKLKREAKSSPSGIDFIDEQFFRLLKDIILYSLQ